MPIPPSRHSRESLRSDKSHARQYSENDALTSVPVPAAGAASSFNAAQAQPQHMPTIPQARDQGDLLDYGNVGQNERPVPGHTETPRPMQSSTQAEGYMHAQSVPVQAPMAQQQQIPTQVPAPTHESQPQTTLLNPAPPTKVRITQGHQSVPVPADLAHAQTYNDGQAQRELEEQLRASESTPKPHASALKDFHNEIRENLPGAAVAKPSILREESTDSSDFVDAKSMLSDDTMR